MKTGERGTLTNGRRLAGLGVLLSLSLAGCLTQRAHVAEGLKSAGPPEAAVLDTYPLACPDVIELELPDKAELSGRYTVGPDGRIDLGDYGKLRVEGHTPVEVTQRLAAETGGDAEAIRVRVLEYRSQPVFLFGQVIGWQKAVPYKGQETVVDLLRRVGGITRGAAPNEVYVVRPHVEKSQRPEIFKVDLQAIILARDEKTNLRLQPFDQVYVGETQQAMLERVVPPWLRPLYRALTNTREKRE